MLIKAILHRQPMWYHTQSPCEHSRLRAALAGADWSAETLHLMAKSSPPLEVSISVLARPQLELIRRGKATKHEGNDQGFDPRY